jgi:proline iminopeptidase
MSSKQLFPPIRPYTTHRLKVQEEQHELYIEECGKPDGLPVVVVHGGPGAGCNPDQRRFFDPSVYRIILFDQRGCGQSTPTGCLENNTTQHLIEDMEAIRTYLNIDQWMLFGGSWGSTLSLLYAQAYPERVKGLVLRSIFLATQQDKHWLFKEGANQIYPYAWQEFVGIIPPSEREDIVKAYYERLSEKNELKRVKYAKAWSLWHRRCSSMLPVVHPEEYSAGSLRLAQIETYYFINNCFIEENQVLDNMNKLRNIPGIIVHGRFDMVTPLRNAYLLQQAWSKAEVDIIRDAGHSSSAPSLADALIHATEKMAKLLADEPAAPPRGLG